MRITVRSVREDLPYLISRDGIRSSPSDERAR
jgi:hypothetical protein